MWDSVQQVGALERTEPEIFFALDGQLRYVHWSPAAEEFTGIQAGDAVGRSFYEVFPEAVGTAAEGLYLDVLRTRRPGGFITEWDGTFYEVAAYPSSGGLTVVAREITDRKQTEAVLAESEKRFWSFFDQLPVAVVIVRGGTITRANGRFLAMFGYSDRSELERTSLPGHFAPSSRRGLLELLGGMQAEGGLPCGCSATARGSDGSRFPVCITGRYVEAPDGPAVACFLFETSEGK